MKNVRLFAGAALLLALAACSTGNADTTTTTSGDAVFERGVTK
ncbi:MAG: hypothetical protein AB7E85_00985 [Pseudobdellovibrionaceae bacterium]